MFHSVHSGSSRHHQQKWMRFADKLHKEFLLVSVLSGTVFVSRTWLVDSGATCHITGARDLFERFTRV
jgi:hypothetical protein